MDTYNFFGRNCHLFVISMFRRTVMSRRDCSIFVGDIHQIVEWDLSTEGPGPDTDPNHRYFSRATGYLLAGPRPRANSTKPYPTPEAWYKFPLVQYTSYRISRHATSIAILYQHGDLATLAFDPSGERGRYRYMLHQIYASANDTLFAEEGAQIWDDLKHGRWHDFFCGRPERRKAGYIGLENKARSGDKITKVLLPFHRWCLRVTDAERSAWLEGEGAGAGAAVADPIAI